MELAYNQILKRMDLKVEAVNLIAQASQNHENQKPLDVPLDQMHTWVQHSCLLEWSTDPGRRTPASTLIQCISFCIYSQFCKAAFVPESFPLMMMWNHA